LILQPCTTRYRRERWHTPDGQTLLAPWPAAVLPGSHLGPTLHSYILHPYHHQRVTQPLLLEQLPQLGIDISAGQLHHILTEDKDAFHQEKVPLKPQPGCAIPLDALQIRVPLPGRLLASGG
jgi:hypothetical protein